MAANRKPEPRVVSEVCSLCGLDWKLHGKAPTTETCIRLLLDEVSALNAQLAVRPVLRPVPYPQPYPVPYPIYPIAPRPWPYSWRITCGSSANYASGLTPQASSAVPQPTIAGTATRALSS